ncbi:MAG: DegT/DnrJ/EryC1/StrS family aminotransferase [Bacteroidaceae bacterium]|nr:DegT/DnrJ/EryC1/StrS family aminotransferase [Bacteroidaceae bacterium]
MSISYYPLSRLVARHQPALGQAVDDVVRSGQYLRGEREAAFEQAWSQAVGVAHTVGCANGLDALTLVLMGWKQREGWADGDEVIVPAMTFAATGLSVLRAGLRPVWCDVGADALIDVADAKRRVTPRTRAAIAVHLYGRVCDIDALRAWQKETGIKLLEDAAQAHLARYQGRPAGGLLDAAAFSFYPGKNLGALGDAGCVCTHDKDLATRVRALANYGATEKYLHTFVGLNSRMDEIQAAVLTARLPYVEDENARRRSLAAQYRAKIHHPGVSLSPVASPDTDEVCHIFPVLVSQPADFQHYMTTCGIETARHYPRALHQQTAFAHIDAPHLPVSERIAREEVSLPIHPLLSDEEVVYIAECINRYEAP